MSAVDVGDRAARAADDVMMVVTDAQLEPCRRAGRFDTAYEPHGREGLEDVVDRLGRDRAEVGPGSLGDRISVGVRLSAERLDDRESRSRHAQTGITQLRDGILECGHHAMQSPFLESFKIKFGERLMNAGSGGSGAVSVR